MSKVRKCRDLTLVEMNGDNLLVIACDSRRYRYEEDYLKTSGSIVGRLQYEYRYWKLWLLGCPTAYYYYLKCRDDPTGKDIIAGIREELTLAKADLTVTGSMEENMPTRQTASDNGTGAAAADLLLGKVQLRSCLLPRPAPSGQ